MSIYSDKLAHLQVVINCQARDAPMCTSEDGLAFKIQQQRTVVAEQDKTCLKTKKFVCVQKKTLNIWAGIQIQPLSPFVAVS